MCTEPTIEMLVIDGLSGPFKVKWLLDNQYLLLSPELVVFTDYSYGDIVEAIRDDDSNLVVKRCIESGNYKTLEFVLPPEWNERKAMTKILQKVERLGGAWAGLFGGLCLVALPPGISYDPSPDIHKALEDSIRE